MDALYYGAAQSSLRSALSLKAEVRKKRRALRRLEAEEGAVRASRRRFRGDQLHELAIQIMGSGIPEYEAAIGPYLEALALVHVAAAASLEAHLNSASAELLGGA